MSKNKTLKDKDTYLLSFQQKTCPYNTILTFGMVFSQITTMPQKKKEEEEKKVGGKQQYKTMEKLNKTKEIVLNMEGLSKSI